MANQITRRLHATWGALFVSSLVSFCIIVLGILFFLRGRILMEQQLKAKLVATAAAAAMQFDGALVEKIRGPEDMSSPLYHRMIAQLQGIIESVPHIHFSYIMRKTEDPNILEFVADADSLKTKNQLDVNSNGVVDIDERPAFPGDTYDATEFPQLREDAFTRPAVDPGVTNDQWGSLISGYAPVRNWETGKIVAVLGVDMSADDYNALAQTVFSPIAFLLVLLAAALIAAYLIYVLCRSRIEEIRVLEVERSSLVLLTSHQIGTPLTLFKWSLEMLRNPDPTEPFDVLLKKHVANLEEGIARMEKILAGFREAGQVEEGKIPFQLDWVLLHEVVQAVLKESEKELGFKNQRVEMELDSHLRVHVDPTLIGGVIRELLDNAKTYSPEDTSILVRAYRKDGFAVISVTDHGQGIPDDDLPRIFEKFSRAANASHFYADGKGLGLFIAKGIVQRAGGNMWMESKIGKGTTVTFTLPLPK